MTDLYLIAHKVRGEAAFDVAHQMSCPICEEHIGEDEPFACHECDSLGYWWIIPTSGHRAYPWWWSNVNNLKLADDDTWICDTIEAVCGTMPPSLPDHYRPRSEPNRDLVTLLGLIHRPLAPIKRRF